MTTWFICRWAHEKMTSRNRNYLWHRLHHEHKTPLCAHHYVSLSILEERGHYHHGDTPPGPACRNCERAYRSVETSR